MYLIQKTKGKASYCSIVCEKGSGYVIKICRDVGGYVTEQEDFIEKDLFDLCIRTGYIKEISKQ